MRITVNQIQSFPYTLIIYICCTMPERRRLLAAIMFTDIVGIYRYDAGRRTESTNKS